MKYRVDPDDFDLATEQDKRGWWEENGQLRRDLEEARAELAKVLGSATEQHLADRRELEEARNLLAQWVDEKRVAPKWETRDFLIRTAPKEGV